MAVTYPDDEQFALLSDPYVFQHTVSKPLSQVQRFIKDKRISMTTLLVGVIRPDSGWFLSKMKTCDPLSGAGF